MTKKELIKAKQSVAYKIRNIKEDYSAMLSEDIPDDIKQELAGLFVQLNEIRTELETK